MGLDVSITKPNVLVAWTANYILSIDLNKVSLIILGFFFKF
jgi:hypothetical protein